MSKRRETSTPSPEPIPVNVVCSLCGEAWSLHREENGEVSTLECIRLLKAARWRINPTPVITYPQPYVWPYRGYEVWWSTAGGSITDTSASDYSVTINATEQRTPTVALASAAS